MDTDIDLRLADGKVAGTIAVNDGDGTTVTVSIMDEHTWDQ